MMVAISISRLLVRIYGQRRLQGRSIGRHSRVNQLAAASMQDSKSPSLHNINVRALVEAREVSRLGKRTQRIRLQKLDSIFTLMDCLGMIYQGILKPFRQFPRKILFDRAAE